MKMELSQDIFCGGDSWKKRRSIYQSEIKRFPAKYFSDRVMAGIVEGMKVISSTFMPLVAYKNPTGKRLQKVSTKAARSKERCAKLRPNRRRERQTLSNQGTQSHEPTFVYWVYRVKEFIGFELLLIQETLRTQRTLRTEEGSRVAVAPNGGRAARCSVYTIRRCFQMKRLFSLFLVSMLVSGLFLAGMGMAKPDKSSTAASTAKLHFNQFLVLSLRSGSVIDFGNIEDPTVSHDASDSTAMWVISNTDWTLSVSEEVKKSPSGASDKLIKDKLGISLTQNEGGFGFHNVNASYSFGAISDEELANLPEGDYEVEVTFTASAK